MIHQPESLKIDNELVPIREISRLTGVNTVTLRAWERRYGLLIPQRTSKGHRLYSRADIDRVKSIQVWLGRGLAISKVKALLVSQTLEPCEQPVDSNWLLLSQQIHVAINGFKRKPLHRLIEDVLSLYPAVMVADYLFSLVLHDLQGDEPGMTARRAFFVNLAMEVILEAQAQQRKAATGEQILLLSATESNNSLLAQLFSYSLLINQYQTEYLGYLTLREALLGCQALDAKIVVLVGYGNMNTAELQLHLNGWQEKSTVPLVLLGDITAPYGVLDIRSSQRVILCNNQQQAVTFINQFLKG